jgi:hypothetical protein
MSSVSTDNLIDIEPIKDADGYFWLRLNPEQLEELRHTINLTMKRRENNRKKMAEKRQHNLTINTPGQGRKAKMTLNIVRVSTGL